jgi:hypothetical protein
VLTENSFGMLYGFHTDKNSITFTELVQFLSICHRSEQRLETTLEATRKADMPYWEAMALRMRAQLHAARGDEEAAGTDLDAAIGVFEKLESRLELGRALVMRGEVKDRARGRELFEACGATGDLAILD